MKFYKITNEIDQTFGNIQWGENISHETSGEDNVYDSGYIYVYETPYHAVLFNLIHEGFDDKTMHLWECKGEMGINNGSRIKVIKLTTLKRIDIPVITKKQRIEFALLCIKEVLPIYENVYQNDQRLIKAIEIIEKYLESEIVDDNIVEIAKNVISIGYVAGTHANIGISKSEYASNIAYAIGHLLSGINSNIRNISRSITYSLDAISINGYTSKRNFITKMLKRWKNE